MTKRQHTTLTTDSGDAKDVQNEASAALVETGAQSSEDISQTQMTQEEMQQVLQSLQMDVAELKSVLPRIASMVESALSENSERMKKIEDALRANGFREHLK